MSAPSARSFKQVLVQPAPAALESPTSLSAAAVARHIETAYPNTLPAVFVTDGTYLSDSVAMLALVRTCAEVSFRTCLQRLCLRPSWQGVQVVINVHLQQLRPVAWFHRRFVHPPSIASRSSYQKDYNFIYCCVYGYLPVPQVLQEPRWLAICHFVRHNALLSNHQMTRHEH